MNKKFLVLTAVFISSVLTFTVCEIKYYNLHTEFQKYKNKTSYVKYLESTGVELSRFRISDVTKYMSMSSMIIEDTYTYKQYMFIQSGDNYVVYPVARKKRNVR